MRVSVQGAPSAAVVVAAGDYLLYIQFTPFLIKSSSRQPLGFKGPYIYTRGGSRCASTHDYLLQLVPTAVPGITSKYYFIVCRVRESRGSLMPSTSRASTTPAIINIIIIYYKVVRLCCRSTRYLCTFV